jgi:hypothetical protein
MVTGLLVVLLNNRSAFLGTEFSLRFTFQGIANRLFSGRYTVFRFDTESVSYFIRGSTFGLRYFISSLT